MKRGVRYLCREGDQCAGKRFRVVACELAQTVCITGDVVRVIDLRPDRDLAVRHDKAAGCVCIRIIDVQKLQVADLRLSAFHPCAVYAPDAPFLPFDRAAPDQREIDRVAWRGVILVVADVPAVDVAVEVRMLVGGQGLSVGTDCVAVHPIALIIARCVHSHVVRRHGKCVFSDIGCAVDTLRRRRQRDINGLAVFLIISDRDEIQQGSVGQRRDDDGVAVMQVFGFVHRQLIVELAEGYARFQIRNRITENAEHGIYDHVVIGHGEGIGAFIRLNKPDLRAVAVRLHDIKLVERCSGKDVQPYRDRFARIRRFPVYGDRITRRVAGLIIDADRMRLRRRGEGLKLRVEAHVGPDVRYGERKGLLIDRNIGFDTAYAVINAEASALIAIPFVRHGRKGDRAAARRGVLVGGRVVVCSADDIDVTVGRCVKSEDNGGS